MSTKSKTATKSKTTEKKTKAKPEKKVEKKVAKTEKKTKKTKSEKPVKSEGEVKEKKARVYREVNKETVNLAMKELTDFIADEIEVLRDSSEKVKGIKFLRSVNKRVKTIHKDYLRVLKMKKKANNGNTKSGFMKPVKITAELTQFTGWEADKEYSRVDVTRFICNYIKEKELQKKEDRRQILPDEKLSKLLRLDSAENKDVPLTYFRLQQLIQPHFIKEKKEEKGEKKEGDKSEKVEKKEEKVEKKEEKKVAPSKKSTTAKKT